MEASATLTRTLLPSVSQVTDFSFLKPEDTFVMTRFLNALLLHFKDCNLTLGEGVIQLSLCLNPILIKGMINDEHSKRSLNQALLNRGLSSDICSLIVNQPSKFLYPELLGIIKSKPQDVALAIASILSKADILANPSPLINDLEDILGQRAIFGKLLSGVDRIKL